MKKLIYSQEDLDLILSLETQEKDKEIERLNNVINGLDNTIENLEEVVEHKDNIINELSKWLKENSKEAQLFESDRYYKHVLNKLKELKEK